MSGPDVWSRVRMGATLVFKRNLQRYNRRRAALTSSGPTILPDRRRRACMAVSAGSKRTYSVCQSLVAGPSDWRSRGQHVAPSAGGSSDVAGVALGTPICRPVAVFPQQRERDGRFPRSLHQMAPGHYPHPPTTALKPLNGLVVATTSLASRRGKFEQMIQVDG